MLPGDRAVKVRGLQVHGERVPRAVAGQRVAVNLGGVDAGDLLRGQTIAPRRRVLGDARRRRPAGTAWRGQGAAARRARQVPPGDERGHWAGWRCRPCWPPGRTRAARASRPPRFRPGDRRYARLRLEGPVGRHAR
ncbi:MAG: hypothetical protein MZW92_53770 [Comamonadaceae bacterium]|nr:hypothetical protein [Comamonadaceae bacterium]